MLHAPVRNPGHRLAFLHGVRAWGRPDMAPYRFAQAILAGEPIDIYNHGHMQRDFTYVDDIVEALVRVAQLPCSGYRLFNIGSSAPVPLLAFVSELEAALGKPAIKRFLPMQPGDVLSTYADVEDLVRFTGYRPSTACERASRNSRHGFWTIPASRRGSAAERALASAR